MPSAVLPHEMQGENLELGTSPGDKVDVFGHVLVELRLVGIMVVRAS